MKRFQVEGSDLRELDDDERVSQMLAHQVTMAGYRVRVVGDVVQVVDPHGAVISTPSSFGEACAARDTLNRRAS